MITMKKKALVAMAMAAAMVAMPVVAGAVTSPGSQSDGTIGLDSSSPSQNNTNTGSQQSNAGSGVNKVAEATVVQGRNNERQEVTNITNAIVSDRYKLVFECVLVGLMIDMMFEVIMGTTATWGCLLLLNSIHLFLEKQEDLFY